MYSTEEMEWDDREKEGGREAMGEGSFTNG